MNRFYKKGYMAERKCIDILRNKGFYYVRSGGSFGPVDIVAFNDEWAKLIQVKSEKNICDIEKRFKKDIALLLGVRAPSNFCKELWVKFPRVNFVVFDVDTGTKRIEVSR